MAAQAQEVISERVYPIQEKWIRKFVLSGVCMAMVALPYYISGLLIAWASLNWQFVSLSISVILITAGNAIIIYLYVRTFVRARAGFHYSLAADGIDVSRIEPSEQNHIPYEKITDVYKKQDWLDAKLGLAAVVVNTGPKNGDGGQTLRSRGVIYWHALGLALDKRLYIQGLTEHDADALIRDIQAEMH